MKMKGRLVLLASTALLCAFGLANSQVALPVSAEGEVSSETPQESEPAQPDPIGQVKDETDYWKNLYENFVVPLLGGVSVTSMLSAIVAIALSVSRRFGEKRHNKVEDARYLKYVAIVEKADEILKFATDTLAKSGEIQEGLVAQVTDFIALAKGFVEEIKDLISNTRELEKLQPALVSLSAILAKMAANTQELVSTGAAEEIRKIAEEAKGLAVHG